MRELIGKGVGFVKENPWIIYSLFLIFIVPLAFYFNTYLTISRFEDNLNEVIRSKAALAEDIVKFIAQDLVDDPAKMEQLILETKALNQDVGDFKIFTFNKEKEIFQISASNLSDEVGKEIDNTKENFYHWLAWREPEDNISYVSYGQNGREWNVIETLKDSAGTKKALILISFPLREFDRMNSQAEWLSYGIMTLTILIVLLLTANNVRLFGYAVTLTKLKEVDAMKDTFISMASHELKAPLVSMKGNVEFLKEEVFSKLDETGKHYIDNIGISTDRMGMLVNDILEVSRLEGNRIPIKLDQVDPRGLIEKSVEEVRPQAEAKKLDLVYAPVALPKVKADPDRVKQIVINLISNAVKYTLRGEVKVTTEVKEKELWVVVADTGVGISAEDLQKLFQKFSRVYNEETKTVSGTGLGLWISRELAQKMGGDITVESIRGVGSHFTLRLPLA
jgi:signal transduction histidine kinase